MSLMILLCQFQNLQQLNKHLKVDNSSLDEYFMPRTLLIRSGYMVHALKYVFVRMF